MSSLAQHSSMSADWGTPGMWVERCRMVLGEIDLDPASSEEHNQVVQARDFYDEKEDGLTKRWQGRVFLNPPGDRGTPQKFFKKLCTEYVRPGDAAVVAAIYLGYSLEQLRWVRPMLQEHFLHPLIAIPDQRIKFRGAGNSPTHGNFFLLLADFCYRKPFAELFSRDCLILKTAVC